MYNSVAIEQNNVNKGRRISFVIHLLLLLIAFFYYFPKVVKIDEGEDKPPYAVKVDFTFQESSLSKFAHEDEGAQRAKAEQAPPKTEEAPKEEQVQPEVIQQTQPTQIETPRPDIKFPTPVLKPVEEEIETKTPQEEAPVKVVKPAETKTTTSTPSSSTTKTNTSSNTSSSGSTSGSSTTKSSTVDGTTSGTGKGKTGTGNGADKGNDGDSGLGNESDGTGAYDGSGDGVFGRKIIYRDLSATKSAVTVSGYVSVKICISRAGLVTYTELNQAETTIRDKTTLKNYLKAARGYKFQPDLTAPKEQCGKLNFKVDNSINNKIR